jgi:hypothetical protein
VAAGSVHYWCEARSVIKIKKGVRDCSSIAWLSILQIYYYRYPIDCGFPLLPSFPTMTLGSPSLEFAIIPPIVDAKQFTCLHWHFRNFKINSVRLLDREAFSPPRRRTVGMRYDETQMIPKFKKKIDDVAVDTVRYIQRRRMYVKIA